MNIFDTLFFPETDIFSEKRYPLLLFFTPLHFLQVVESPPGSIIDSEAELFLERGLCHAHTPAPLGDNRDAFLRLIRGVGERNDSLVAQFNGLAAPSSRAPGDNESHDVKQSIVSSLLSQYGVKHATGKTELQLWQARLVLAVAEIMDSQEEALRERLFFFNEDEIAAFRSLQGAAEPNAEDLFSELANIKEQLEKSRLGGISKRIEAWLRLLHTQPLPQVQVWLASTRDSANEVFNRYESVGKSHAVPVLKLLLPTQIAVSGKYAVEQIEEFQQATMPIHQGLVADFQRIVKTIPYVRDEYASLLPYDTNWAEQWERALDDFFPAKNDGRQDVTFYLLPDQPIDRLLSRSQTSDAAQRNPAHGLLAVLNETS